MTKTPTLLRLTALLHQTVPSPTQHSLREYIGELTRSYQYQHPTAQVALLRSAGEQISGDSQQPQQSKPSSDTFACMSALGTPMEPLQHLERIWKSTVGDLIVVEPCTLRYLEHLLHDASFALRVGGVLLLALPHTELNEISRNALEQLAAARGFSSTFVEHSSSHKEQVICFERREKFPLSKLITKKKAFVYNCYFDTGGGGERSTIDFAAALDDLGYEVSLVTTRPTTCTLADLQSAFGLDKRYTWPIRYFTSEKTLSRAVKDEAIEVFVNHTYASYLPNPAPIGVYVVMFPLPTYPSHIASLQTYSTLCCISEFTQEYVRRFWYEKLATEVVYPPISRSHEQIDNGLFSRKKRLVLQIGRFNVEGHSKCQLEAIQAFCQLREENVLSSQWQMKVVGRVNAGAHNERYIERCRETITPGADVELITNAAFSEIRRLYQQAFCLWQFTGFGLDFGEAPQFCEHLGLVAMDCFSYGTIPLIYQRGGMLPLIRHGENGFCFSSLTELKEIMGELAGSFAGPLHRAYFEESRASADRLSFSEYREALASLLWRASKRRELRPSALASVQQRHEHSPIVADSNQVQGVSV